MFRLFGAYLLIISGKEVDRMAVIYAALIMKGKRTFASIPPTVKEKVREILIDVEMEELIKE